MAGASLLSTTLKAYVHVAHAITEYAKPRHCDMQHVILSQYGLKKVFAYSVRMAKLLSRRNCNNFTIEKYWSRSTQAS